MIDPVPTHESDDYKVPCPCGKGSIEWTVESPTNGYSRYSETARTLNCAVCAQAWEFSKGSTRELRNKADLARSRDAHHRRNDARAALMKNPGSAELKQALAAAEAEYSALSKAVRRHPYDVYY